MNYIKEAENYLRHYASFKKAAEHARHMIAKISKRGAPSDKVTASYDITGIHADHPVNTLNDLYELQKWHQVLENNMQEINHIESILDDIGSREGCRDFKKILIMWYVERKDKDLIAEELSYSRRNLFYLKARAIEVFAIDLFGILAIEAM